MPKDDYITNPDSTDANGQSNQSSNTQTNNSSKARNMNNDELAAYLKSIDATLKSMLNNGQTMSQANMRNQTYGKNSFRQSYSNYMGGRSSYGRSNVRSGHVSPSSFADGIQDALLESILGSDFKDKMQKNMEAFADLIGVSLRDVPGELGRAFGLKLIKDFKASKFGEEFTKKFGGLKNKAVGVARDGFASGLKSFDKKNNLTGNNSYYNKYSQYMSKQSETTFKDQKSTFDSTASSGLQDTVTDMSNRSSSYMDTVLTHLQSIDDNLYVYANRHVGDKASDFGYDNPDKENPYENILDEVEKRTKNINDRAGKTNKAAEAAKQAESTFSASEIPDIGAAVASEADVAATGQAAEAAMSGLTSSVTSVVKAFPEVAIAAAAVAVALWAAGPAIESFKEMLSSAGKSFNRTADARKKKVELAQKRLEADVETMVKKPFEILEQAAQKLYDTWDNNLRIINGTQGYNKSDLQDLMSTYAQRLRDEGLTKVVSGADITDNLAKVLSSGLSGQVAEEFAYQATKLNAAVPTQDFFEYAETYASLAANQIKQGKSQSDAIKYANEQLQLFASDVLYASRTLAGGFTTGLKDASSLFTESVKIAQASRTGNPSEIAGVLTAVSAATGAIAPDLVSQMTELLTKATTGGNSDEITALRSLAEVNASNTEFLKQVADDPKKIFSTIFNNLSKMQSMSPGAYMEVAEGLSSTFGMSMDSFSRIDFKYLADAISNMSVTSASLDENMKHLASGETTLTAEQLKMQQINQYMLDEGLAYVLDNEAARAIQQHMWDEQIAQQLQEHTYAVELKGSALKFLEGIRSTVDNLSTILNPFSLIKKTIDLVDTSLQTSAEDKDLKKMLEAGKVGKGNKTSLYQLTTRGKDLKVTGDLLSLMGKQSSFTSIQNGRELVDDIYKITNPAYALLNSGQASPSLMSALNSSAKSNMSSSFSSRSQYSWNSVGKSVATAIKNTPTSNNIVSTAASTATKSSTSSSAASIKNKLDKILGDDYIQENYIAKGKGYEEWKKDAKKALGGKDVSDAIEAAGYSETAVQQKFDQSAAEYGAAKMAERYAREEQFWTNIEDNTKTLIDNTMTIIDNTNTLIELVTTSNSWLSKIYSVANGYYKSWTSYIMQHTVYNSAYTYSDVQRIKDKENNKGKDDAINALAETLVKNAVDLRDPTVQTNALLSRILLILSAIEQQNNAKSSSSLSLSDSLQGAALGL